MGTAYCIGSNGPVVAATVSMRGLLLSYHHTLYQVQTCSLLISNTSMASSSSSSHSAPVSSSRSYKYDVFLSFRGEDTRKTFVDHLYSTLKQHLIEIYKDDKTLPRGESIDQSLFEAIEESRMAIIIFSKNYADSSWCLEELAHIMKCKDERELTVIPIFYDVEPTDVRNQKSIFGEAFARQEVKNVTKAEIWRKALVDVGNIAGWEPKNIADGHESQFIQEIVDSILGRLSVLNSCVDEDLVGMRARSEELESLLDIGSEGVRMVGLWGGGGSGKTTLATFVYMKISQHFHGHNIIIGNVREETSKCGLNKLQENILSALFKREMKVHSVLEGKQMIKSMLCRRKVLLLLDDVDRLDQLEALAGNHNWFGSGSRIIITTRDEHLLRTPRVDHVYHVKLLSDDEAIRLLKKHAYNEKAPIEDYETLSLQLVSYAAGLPLSLKVLGSFLYDKNKKEWISALKKLKDIPNPEVMGKLKISYDGLDFCEKELFLDIACFWRRHMVDSAMETLEACGFHPEIGIKVLIQKALITIMGNGINATFDMHDVIQEMGHYIVKGEHPNSPEKHSRVWERENITEMCSRNAIMENYTIEAIQHYSGNKHDYSLSNLVSNMKKLRWLKCGDEGPNEVEDEWPIFLSDELRYIHLYDHYVRSPFQISLLPMKLVVLKLEHSMQKELWKGYQHLPHLKVLQLQNMWELRRTPDFSGMPRLQKLTLLSCPKLEKIHPSLDNHTSLEYLTASYCDELKRLPTFSHVINMKVLEMSGLKISFTIGFNLSQLTHLKSLDLSFCYGQLLELPELPSSLAILTAHNSTFSVVGDFYENCKELCQVQLEVNNGWSTERLLQFMLKGKAIENGCMFLHFQGDLEIAKGFTPHLRTGDNYRLDLPENWWNDFSGFLMCAVSRRYYGYRHFPSVLVRMKDVTGMDSEDDAVSEESDRDKSTIVWYVSFGSLRHTAWWDQTSNAISFNIGTSNNERPFDPSGFAVKLVDKKSGRCLTETSTNSSSHYTPKIDIHHDSASELVVALDPYQLDKFDW